MKLQVLLEGDRRDALALQQFLLEHVDGLDVELDTAGRLNVRFEHWEDTTCILDIERRDDKVAIGFKPSNGSRTMIAPTWFKSANDPALLEHLLRAFYSTVGEDVADVLKELHSKHSNERKWHFGYPQKGDPDFFKPFPYFVPGRPQRALMKMGDSAISGETVVCMAVMKAPSSEYVAEASAALNDFNDKVLRVKPRPEQLEMGTDSDVTYFLYAVKRAD